MSVSIHLAKRDDYPNLAGWIETVSQNPDRHCLHSWSGEDSKALSSRLLGYYDDGELEYFLAREDDRIIGSMGCEYDESLGRGWLHGPHVLNSLYGIIVVRMFEELHQGLPRTIRKLDAFLNEANIMGRDFYIKQGFQENPGRAYEYWLLPGKRKTGAGKRGEIIGTEQESSFLELFEGIFPNAYYSGERILAMNSHQVFVSSEGGKLDGFAVASVEPGMDSGEIQFLGVRENARGRGVGKALLLSAIDWLLDVKGMTKATLNVSEERQNARQLYEAVGFQLQFTGVSLEMALE